ncbi:polysaccharide biosynthesis tyrosine autokinase [Dactylosporangium matsuzakiense]|uniref:non-specific protein-tyrosine kinase n=1 Tax=Dactylosporangium matsuzakiense TaxID=53360 RepID=A0A9W6KMX1_9ACTN|nr:polysaccharide biosynthesis tyrosine autokinase [Dactylosporangium matsuzakiense]UWZ48109.1 polysaccharide biosynthesis tyrosine autokinase [Dactylosporangium matsuzakiense]GLL03125.1 chromosome partitioning protein [Dactylosporangium matsuzakiense]
MNLHDYLRVLRKRWPFVVITFAVAVVLGVLVTLNTTPRYASTLTFFVTTSNQGSAGDAYQGGLYSQQRVKSYADLLTSERLGQAVVDDLALPMSAVTLVSKVDAIVVPDTVLLRVTVTDTSRDQSLRIAQALGRQFTRLVGQLETPPDAAAAPVKVEVVGGPRLEAAPVAPRPLRNMGIAVALGLLLGVGLAVLRETLDTSIRSAEALRDISGAPDLVTVAFDATAKDSPLAVGDAGFSPRAEAFRQLRTNLKFVDVGRPLKVLALVSAVPSEGKSTFAANLATTMAAQDGARILLIEADLRRPKVADYLGVEGSVGLTNVLIGQVGIDDVLQPLGRNDLWVLPSGSIPPNPSELLASPRMHELLEELKSRYDLIILDSPALLPVTDGAVAASHADGSLLIVRYGHTTRTQVNKALDMLAAVDATIIGCGLNMVPGKGGDAYTYQYDYGYGDDTSHRPRLVDQLEEAKHLTGRQSAASSPRPAARPRRRSRAKVH